MFIGVVIIVLGLLFFVEAIVPGFSLNFHYVWPCAVSLIAIYVMIKKKRIDAFGSFLILISVWYLLYYLGYLSVNISDVFWPLLLIFMGISIIFNTLIYKAGGKRVKGKVTTKGDINYYGVFSGVEEKIKAKDFKGANLYSIFGGIDLDLREMQLKENAVITGYAIFGGIDLLVSDTYNVVVQGTAFFGGNENKSTNTFDEKRPTLYIRCFSVFGGASIK